MYSPTYLILFVGMAAGFIIPDGQPDGVYGVSYDNDGADVHTFLAEPLSQAEVAQVAARAGEFSSPSRITARQTDQTICAGYELDHGATDSAVEALKRQCAPGAVNSGYDFYSISGSTVAYVCSYGSTGYVCTRDELTDTYARITQVCGWYKAGWRERWYDGRTGAAVGYENRNTKFCGRGV